MQKLEIVAMLLRNSAAGPQKSHGTGFAPVNVALCKYWGKRNPELNLPVTSSLSIALPSKGATARLTPHQEQQDLVILNGKKLEADSKFVKRLSAFLDLFRASNTWHLKIDISMNIPVGAGLASSACGFASMVLALDDLFNWQLSERDLSILARLGSGSAARSLWNGFVEWHAGVNADGMDSYAEPLSNQWQDLCIGILPISDHEKPISSRDAMLTTVDTSVLYQSWPQQVTQDMQRIKQAIQAKDISLLGQASESNALSMHATMLSSWPPVCYYLPETIEAMHKVWGLRKEGAKVFFTQDAGPNLKLIFMHQDKPAIQKIFPKVDVVEVFPKDKHAK